MSKLFGAQTTLAYAQNGVGTGGTLTVSDGRHAASIALLGDYMAGSFVAVAEGHGGTLITETSQDRIAFLAVPGLSDDEQKTRHNGMHHCAFEYDGFDA